MSRILRYGLLALVCATPFAIPQASEARTVPAARRGYYVSNYYGRHYYPHWHWHRHFRR
jgi:hypothetical protein